MLEPLQASTRINLEKVSVLIVDDSAPSLDLLAQVVTGFGVKTLQRAESAKVAQVQLRERTFDLVISATNMAGVDGYELVKWLRLGALEANRYVPVILVSGHTPPSQVFKARDSGANFTVAKPITPKVLLERILWAAREERQFIECDSRRSASKAGAVTTCRPNWASSRAITCRRIRSTPCCGPRK